MKRAVVEVILTLIVTIVLLGTFYSLVRGSLVGFGDAAHHLFLFMDVGIGLWILLLAITVSLKRPAGVWATLLFALIGVVANLLTVTVVGLVQSGGAPEFMRWAVEAGLAFLVAAAVMVPLVHKRFTAGAEAAETRGWRAT